MRIISWLLVLTFFRLLPASANDGRYLMRGGVIYPVQETKISIEKEVLSFTCRDKICSVDVQLQFYNPENTERKLLIGFQAFGDASYSDLLENQISNFRIEKDGKVLAYKLKAAECADCELKDTAGF